MSKEVKLLLVDDDDALRKSLCDQPEFSELFTVDEAKSGSEALELIGREAYTLVLLDIGLPDLDGRDVCRSMRSARVNAPIILMTGADTEADTSVKSEVGADDFPQPPVVQFDGRRFGCAAVVAVAAQVDDVARFP